MTWDRACTKAVKTFNNIPYFLLMEFVQAAHFGLFLLAMELLRLEVHIAHLLLILVDSSYLICVFWVWGWGFSSVDFFGSIPKSGLFSTPIYLNVNVIKGNCWILLDLQRISKIEIHK